MKLILARNLQKFQEWCKENGYDWARARSSTIYVDQIEKVYGISNVEEVILYQDWWESDMVKRGDAMDVLFAVFQRVNRAPRCIKPPLGVMPEWLWIEKRIQELIDVIQRYESVGGRERDNNTIIKWCHEVAELSILLQEHKGKK